MKNIKHNLDILDRHRKDFALGIMSSPGLSKSSQIHQWAKEHGRNVTELIISQRMPSEISGMPMPVQETQKMEVFDYDTLLKMEDGDILFFDEFTNGNIQTLNACLTLIQERRMISGKELPDVLIVAAGNPQGSCELLPQTKQRFMWTTATFDHLSWRKYEFKTHGFIPTSALCSSIANAYRGNFPRSESNYLTARTAENLMKIASSIEMDDPFWSTLDDIDSSVRSYVYKSVNVDEELRKMLEPCINVALSMEAGEALVNNLFDIDAVSRLQQLLASCSRGLYGKEGETFVELLKKEDA